MRHNHWIPILYTKGCAPCKVRQLRYGFRLDPIGYNATRDAVWNDTQYTVGERLWILEQTHPIEVNE